jgi:DNA-binding MarR family transcriptional regulator
VRSEPVARRRALHGRRLTGAAPPRTLYGARILLATLDGAEGPLSQSAIADRLFVTGASVSSLVDTLERTGLVRRTRSTNDRRVVLVALTDAAYPVIDAYLAEVTTLHAHEFAVLDEQERETFVRLLAKVASSVEALDLDAVVAKARARRIPRTARRPR